MHTPQCKNNSGQTVASGARFADLLLAYFTENLAYQPPLIRRLSSEASKRLPLVLLAQEQAQRANGAVTGTAQSSLRALERLLASIAKFRTPHLAVAKDNFQLRPDDAVGSGGYQPSILEFLIDQIKQARGEVKAIQDSCTNREAT